MAKKPLDIDLNDAPCHEHTRDVSQESLLTAEQSAPNAHGAENQSFVDTDADSAANDESRLDPEPPPRKIGKWVVHAVGALAAIGWAVFWMMRAEPSATLNVSSPPPSVDATPTPPRAAPGAGSAATPPRDKPIDGPLPVASASNFLYNSSHQAAELRPIFLSKVLVTTEENIPGGVKFNQLPWSPSLRVGIQTYDQGVVMLTPEKGEGLVSFRVPDGAKSFAALLGLAGGSNPAHKGRCEREGASATFVVYTNGIEAFRRIIVGTDGRHDEIKVELAPSVKTVTLIVDNADGDSQCDAPVWIDARFMVEPAAAPGQIARGQ